MDRFFGGMLIVIKTCEILINEKRRPSSIKLCVYVFML